jgi:plastocyanin
MPSRHSRTASATLGLLVLAACGGSDEPSGPDTRPVSLVVAGPDTRVGVGQTLQLGVTGRSATGTPVPIDGTPQWRSNNTSIATVSSAGIVSGRSAGTALITATVGGLEASLQVTVTQSLSNTVDVFTPGNIFSPSEITIPVGGTVRFNIFGAIHDAVFDRSVAGAPQDVPRVNGQIVSRTFPTRGAFPFVCTLHPGMTGRVTVQ